MKKLTINSLLSLCLFASVGHADDSRYYHTLPAGIKVKATLNKVVLPPKADAITFLGMGSNDFRLQITLNNSTKVPFSLKENKNNNFRSDTLNLSFEFNDQDLNPYIRNHTYHQHQNTIFSFQNDGNICIKSFHRLPREEYGCIDPTIEVNKMLERGQLRKNISVKQKLRDSGGDANRYFEHPITSHYTLEILK